MSADLGRCRSCQAPILWVVLQSGKRAPLDKATTVVFDEEGVSFTGHLNHFATCPQSKEWKKS